MDEFRGISWTDGTGIGISWEFRGQTELALCESIKLLRFEREFALTVIRNNLFSVSWRDGADTLGSGHNDQSASSVCPRNFSLSRLTNACNPEALAGVASCTISSGPWSTTYTYDANSNVTSRTDGRGTVTKYTYDALNRITGKSYTNDPANTPALSYGYDQEYPFQQTQNENNPVDHLNWINATVGTTNVAAWASGDYDQRGNLTGYLTCLGSKPGDRKV